jgi:hypothetical protein
MNVNALSRFDYGKIKKQYDALGKENIRLTQSTLTLIQDINANKSLYTFPVLTSDNATGVKPAEIRLDPNDEMVVTQIGFYLLAKKLQGPKADSYDGYYYLTHNAIYQNQVAVAGLPFYDGIFRLSINNINYIDKYDLRKHEQYQRSEWNTQGSVNKSFATLPSIESESDGMYPVSPMVVLSGAKKLDLSVSLPNPIAPYQLQFTGNDGNAQTFNIESIAIVCRGMLAQNGAVYQGTPKKSSK